MPIVNMFTPEELIENRIKSLFPDNMVFVEVDTDDLDDNVFGKVVNEDEKIGAIILNAGFRTDPLVGNSRKPQQRLKMLWQVVVICPREKYKTHGGPKLLEVMQTLKGYRLSEEVGIMQLIDDERGFNRPEYTGDLAYLPAMFTVETVI